MTENRNDGKNKPPDWKRCLCQVGLCPLPAHRPALGLDGGDGRQGVNADASMKAEAIPGCNALYAVGYADGAGSGMKAEAVPGCNALYAVGYANGAGSGMKAEAIPGWKGDVRHTGWRAARAPAGAAGRNGRRPSWREPGRGGAGRGRGGD